MRGPAKRFADDAGRLHEIAKERCGNVRHLATLLFKAAAPGECRRRADVLDASRPGGFMNASDEQGDVCTRPSSVRVQLIEDEEAQTYGSLDQPAFTGPR